jgi:hypothetical protein
MSLFSVLTQVPWGSVIDAAPKVAEGATKLWNAVGRKKKDGSPASASVSPVPAHDPLATEAEQIKSLHNQMQAARVALAELRGEMQTASEIIKTLAEQNTTLVQQVELTRRRLARVVMVSGGVGVALVVAVVYLLSKS